MYQKTNYFSFKNGTRSTIFINLLRRRRKYPANTCWSSKGPQRNNILSSKTFWTRPNNKKLLHWRRLQNVLKTSLEDVLITFLEDVFKTSLRQANCLLGISLSNKSKCVYLRYAQISRYNKSFSSSFSSTSNA